MRTETTLLALASLASGVALAFYKPYRRWAKAHRTEDIALSVAGAVSFVALVRSASIDTSGAPIAPGSASGFTQVTATPMPAKAGKTYRAVIVTHGLVNDADAIDVAAAATKRGFKNVSAVSARPSGWPGTETGDWYVEATYEGSPQTFDRSYGSFAAGADIVDVWEST